jgi:hypothetical protein
MLKRNFASMMSLIVSPFLVSAAWAGGSFVPGNVCKTSGTGAPSDITYNFSSVGKVAGTSGTKVVLCPIPNTVTSTIASASLFFVAGVRDDSTTANVTCNFSVQNGSGSFWTSGSIGTTTSGINSYTNTYTVVSPAGIAPMNTAWATCTMGASTYVERIGFYW